VICRYSKNDPTEPRPRAGVSLSGERPLLAYSVEKLGFSVLGLFRQLVIESVNCQQDSVQPTRANSGEAIVVER